MARELGKIRGHRDDCKDYRTDGARWTDAHFIGKAPGRRYTRAHSYVYTKDFAMKRLIASLAALAAVACLLSTCGQKGPLYLPDDAKNPDGHSQSHQHS